MSERQLGHVLFRVLGLWMVAEAVAQTGNAYSGWVHLYEPATAIEKSAILAPVVMYLATGLVVWGWSGRLAALVFSDTPKLATVSPLTALDVYRAVVSALGLFLIVTAIPTVVSWLAVWVQSTWGEAHLTPSDREALVGIASRGQFASLVAQCALGLFLYLGPHRVVGWARESFSSHLAEDESEQ
jgi:hypothetical protein